MLPFGVTNGPPYFQEFMLDLYGGGSSSAPNMLGEYMSDLNAMLDVWVDDLQLGTGDVQCSPDDPSEGEGGDYFDNHILA